MLPLLDVQHLNERAPGHVVSTEAGLTCVLIPRFELPADLRPTSSDLLIRLSPGYPDVPPDMWWFDPPVQRLDGRQIPCTQVRERHLGREWQRWSRHLNPSQWRSGIDSLQSFLAIIRRELHAAATATTT
jgi:hypothetical protein